MSQEQPPQGSQSPHQPQGSPPQPGQTPHFGGQQRPPYGPNVQMHSPPPPREPLPFPRKFLAQIDYLVLRSEDVMELLRRGESQGALVRFFLFVALLMGAIYGGVMGATNLLQGSDMLLQHKLAQILVSAIKVPILFLLSLFIVLPPIYVSNAFAGAKLRFGKIAASLFGSIAIQLVALASLATVAFFFALTSRSYHFIKLLHVAFFVYAGFVGLQFLVRMFRMNTGERNKRTPAILFLGWLLLYGFVGIQLAWTLRPFVGSPNEPFQVFREREGNVVGSLFYSLEEFLIPNWDTEPGGDSEGAARQQNEINPE